MQISTAKPRKKFKSGTELRLAGTDFLKYYKANKDKEVPEAPSRWRKEHETLIAAATAGKPQVESAAGVSSSEAGGSGGAASGQTSVAIAAGTAGVSSMSSATEGGPSGTAATAGGAGTETAAVTAAAAPAGAKLRVGDKVVVIDKGVVGYVAGCRSRPFPV